MANGKKLRFHIQMNKNFAHVGILFILDYMIVIDLLLAKTL